MTGDQTCALPIWTSRTRNDENGNKVTIVPKEPVFGEQHVDTGVAGAEGIDTERQITDEEFRKLIEGKELDIDANISMNGLDVDESDLI